MNKLTSLFAMTPLLFASSFSRAASDNSSDLRYCLDLPTVQQIAKCSGEISAGSKHPTYTKEEVERIISEEKAKMPPPAGASSGAPVTSSDTRNKNLVPENSESNGD